MCGDHQPMAVEPNKIGSAGRAGCNDDGLIVDAANVNDE
jgi:hypothetical protein